MLQGDSLPSNTDVTKLLYGDRRLPNDRMYLVLEPAAQELLLRVPKTSPHYVLLAYILQYAQMKRSDAGYSGAQDDFGARAVEAQVEVFIAGVIERKLPNTWKQYGDMLAKSFDPEYLEYLRLQEKFGKK